MMFWNTCKWQHKWHSFYTNLTGWLKDTYLDFQVTFVSLFMANSIWYSRLCWNTLLSQILTFACVRTCFNILVSQILTFACVVMIDIEWQSVTQAATQAVQHSWAQGRGQHANDLSRALPTIRGFWQGQRGSVTSHDKHSRPDRDVVRGRWPHGIL